MAEQDYFIIESSGQPMMNGVMVIVVKNEGALNSLPEAAAAGSIAVLQDASAGWMKSLSGTWEQMGLDTGTLALVVNMGTISSLPVTKSAPGVTSRMVVASCEFGTPSAITGDMTVTTYNGSIKLSGSIRANSSTTIKLLLIDSGTITAT